jgi:taurine dioxygenase
VTPNHSSARPLESRPLSPGLGAEVLGIDLSTPLSPNTFRQIYDLFLDAQVLLFRRQNLDGASQVAFGRLFGELQIHVMDQYHAGAHPELYQLTNLDEEGNPNGKHPDKGTLAWHTDGSWREVTGQATILFAEVTLASGSGGETHFCDMYAALEHLTETHGPLVHVYATHSLDFSRNRRHGEEPLTSKQRKQIPPVTHPLVRVHPETGAHALFLGDHAETIVGMEYEAGRTLIDELNAQAIAPSRVYEHTWLSGDLMVWDNRCVQHRATAYDTSVHARVVRRCTVLGEKPRGPID